MSVSASGSVGNAITFRTTGGRTTVTRKPKPKKTKAPAQIPSRNAVKIASALTKWANKSSWKAPGETVRDRDLWKQRTPPGKKWNTWITEIVGGQSGLWLQYTRSGYAALPPDYAALWYARSPGFGSIALMDEQGKWTQSLGPAELFYIYVSALQSAGLGWLQPSNPPVYTP